VAERPIKKSERQANSAADSTSAASQNQPSNPDQVEGSAALPDGIKPSSSPRPVKKGDAPKSEEKRGSGKRSDRGKKSDKTNAPPVNPALMRGPKPPKPSEAKPEIETPSEAESESAESESSEAEIES